MTDGTLVSLLTARSGIATSEDSRFALLADVLKDTAKYHLLLQDMSFDQATFYGRYGCTQNSLLDKIAELLTEQSRGHRDASASLILLFGRSIEISSRYASGGPEPTEDELRSLQIIASESDDFASALFKVYDFGDLASAEGSDSESHARLDWESLSLHRLGTTSLIFSIRTDGLESRKLVLKLSHVLFTTVGPIASATSSYFAEWRDLSRECLFTARVMASGVGWILEDFIEGPTLREFVKLNVADMDALDLALCIFPPIVEALQSFHVINQGRGHGDVNPANIIIQLRSAATPEISSRDSPYKYVAYFIDMGRNLLASDTIGRVRSADASYVAPEVRKMPPDQRIVDRTADFFSLGRILAFCLGYEGSDGFYFLDEKLFSDQPMLARVASGLINSGPDARLRYVKNLNKTDGSSSSKELDDLEVLARYTVALMEMVKEVSDKSVVSAHAGLHVLSQGLFGTWQAVGISLRQLFRTWKRREVLSFYEVAGSARIIASAFAYLLGIACIIYVALLEVHHDPLGLGSIFKTLGFRENDKLFNWELLIVSASFLIASFQYNVVVYGGISFLHTCAGPVVRSLSEAWLWIVTVTVLVCMGIALFINPELWILVSAAGQTMAITNNMLAIIARRAIARRLENETAGNQWYKVSAIVLQAKYDILSYWTPTYIAYTSFLYTLAILAWLGVLHDFMVYAVAIGVVNVFVLSYSQATKQGPILRGNLSQYSIAGENLRAADEAGAPVAIGTAKSGLSSIGISGHED